MAKLWNVIYSHICRISGLVARNTTVGDMAPCRPDGAVLNCQLSMVPGARRQEAALGGSTVAEEGEEGASLGVVALLLAGCGCRGLSSVNEIGRGGTTVGVGEPARRGGARHGLRGHLAQCQCLLVHVTRYDLRIAKGKHA